MQAAEETSDEIKNAHNSEGPDPVLTIDDPALARIAVAQIRAQAAEKALDEAVLAAREAGFSWQIIADLLGMIRQGANKRFSAA